MHTKAAINTIKNVGRCDGGVTSIAQVELDGLCDTAEAGVDCADALAMWYRLRNDGYSTLRLHEVQQIEKALKKAGKL